jgi:hypothetical protein
MPTLMRASSILTRPRHHHPPRQSQTNPLTSFAVTNLPQPVLEFNEEDEEEFHAGPTRLGTREETSMTRTTSTAIVIQASLFLPQCMSLMTNMWDGWGREEKEAIKAAERFHDISAAGYLDEEQSAHGSG